MQTCGMYARVYASPCPTSVFPDRDIAANKSAFLRAAVIRLSRMSQSGCSAAHCANITSALHACWAAPLRPGQHLCALGSTSAPHLWLQCWLLSLQSCVWVTTSHDRPTMLGILVPPPMRITWPQLPELIRHLCARECMAVHAPILCRMVLDAFQIPCGRTVQLFAAAAYPLSASESLPPIYDERTDFKCSYKISSSYAE